MHPLLCPRYSTAALLWARGNWQRIESLVAHKLWVSEKVKTEKCLLLRFLKNYSGLAYMQTVDISEIYPQQVHHAEGICEGAKGID